jgi:predicted DNA binding CopG/RHH family protein
MKDTTITFRLRESEKEQLVAKAAAKDIPVSQLVREAVKKYLEENKE